MTPLTKTTYRNSTRIVCDLLTITQCTDRNGIAVTSLCQKSNLSHGRLQNFLTTLTGSGLINQIKFDGKNTFVITEKGKLFLEEYKKFHEFASSFGLEI
jgi:predicted transcriptional regulator|tara:strand:+ start:221 stop:517 length:297 start_codon:yes stop_codon:yes gene_type:complete